MTRSWQFALSIAVVCGIAGGTDASAQSAAPVTASTTVPRSVPFNGQVVTPNGEARTGTVMLTFALYTDQQDGAPIWTEQQQVTLDNGGRYSLVLGSVSADGLPADAFAAGTPRWLGVQVEAEKEQPRMMLLSVPYALKAGDADTIGGKPVSEFVLNTRLFDTVTSTLKEAGYPDRTNDPTAPAVTVGRIPRFTTVGGAIDDSNIYQDGSANIGIGTLTPAGPLHVLGSTSYKTFFMQGGHPAGAGFTIFSTATPGRQYTIAATASGAAGTPGSLVVYDEVAGQFRMVIEPGGQIGIGTATPANKMHVVGAGDRALYGTTTSSLEGVKAECLTGGINCWAVYGLALTGDTGGYFYGGRGVYARAATDDASSPGVEASSSGSSAYAIEAVSDDYRGLYVESQPGLYGAIINGGTATDFGISVTGDSNIAGDLNVTGVVTGPVGEEMHNIDASSLETGDVVVVSGTSEAITGDRPVLSVRKATAAYDTGVAGVVEQALYVPDAATKATYEAEQSVRREARLARAEADKKAAATGTKAVYSNLPTPKQTISDAEGTVHSTQATTVASGGYARLLSRGTVKAVKVDASFGAIHVGDLLTTSTTPGHAMKVTDKVAAIGAIVGKALGDLESGTGTIPVLLVAK